MTGPARTVLHVFATFGAGGPQIRACQLIAHLGPDLRHVIVAMDGRTEAAAQLPRDAAVEFATPPPRGGFVAAVRTWRALLRALSPHLVLTYNWGAIEAAFAARSLRLPLVHHEDGFLPDEAERRHLRRTWMRRFALRGVPVVVPSRVLQGIARREWWVADRRLHLLPNGVDLRRFRPHRPPGRLPLVIGTVGGLRPEKDHATLLRALVRCREARAVIVGGGALDAELRQLATSLGVAERVEFAGPVADTSSWYAKFDVFVLSSRTEQMPIALLEAMACGLPVVATEVGDVRTILPEFAQAFVVPRQSPDALATALQTVLGDASLRARLGADNRRSVEAKYEAVSCLDRFAKVYRGAMR